MRRLCWLLIPVLATAAQGEDGAFPKTEKVEESLKELDQMPVAVEYRNISKAINDIQQERQKQTEELREKLQKLAESEPHRCESGIARREEAGTRRDDLPAG